jgi:hypothetical protein
VSDISAVSDGQVLRRAGSALGFGTLDLTSGLTFGASRSVTVRAAAQVNGATGAVQAGWGMTSTRTAAGVYVITLSPALTGPVAVVTPYSPGGPVVAMVDAVSGASITVRTFGAVSGTLVDCWFFILVTGP